MSFRLVPKSVTLNDLERRNGVILRYFSEFGSFRGALRKSSRSLSHLLMSSFVYDGLTRQALRDDRHDGCQKTTPIVTAGRVSGA